MKDFVEVLQNTPKPTINKYLRELSGDGKIEFVGNPKISRGKSMSFWRIK